MSKKVLDMTGFARMNNVLAKNTELRDAFLECEEDYVEKLKKKPIFRKTVRVFQDEFTADELNQLALETMDDIECCRVSPEDLDHYEFLMICLTAAIVDFQKVNEHTKDPDFSGMEK